MNRMSAAAMAAAAALMLAACGGGDDVFQPPGGGGNGPPTLPPPASAPALKTVLAAKYGVVDYPVGAAYEVVVTGAPTPDQGLLLKHFSSVTAEYSMKPDIIWPNAPGTNQPAAAPNFVDADEVYDVALLNNIKVRGHTLLWHQTAPTWFFANNPDRVTLSQRLCQYINAVVTHFPQIYAWDVVNEVASDTQNAANPYRTASPWYQAYLAAGVANPGFEYVSDAFACANTARNNAGRNSGNMKLMLNDYNTELPGKRANVIQIVQSLVNASVPIDGVGHQFHLQINADVSQVTAALAAVEAINGTLVNHVTELDVSIYADPGECFAQRTIPPCLADVGATAPQALLSAQALKYRELFNAFNRPRVTSVTLWGILDNRSWLNTFPVTRTNHPLLFDAAGNPKWAFWTVVDPSIAVP
ncbi:MAG TPA: endo-1,4-beta-xylanase [Steroidobacteraceae bacterium]|nr:endo-1,4-beta-xylanase [Steroidobacteraceae bacterium]